MSHLNSYFKYLELQMNFSEHTLQKYHYVLSDLEKFAKLIDTDIDDLTLLDLKQYSLQLVDKRYSRATQAQNISILKSYYKYLLRESIITKSPASSLVYPKKDSRLPKTLYESELYALFESIETSRKFGKRNLAILTVLYSTGMRVSELESLKVDQFAQNHKSITVIGKGNKQRVVPLNDYTYNIVREYIDLERDVLLAGNECDMLWINNRHTNLTVRGIRYIINNIVDHSALLIKVSPHTLRHSFASHLLNAGMDIRMVQELLGHESLTTTEVYTHLDTAMLSEQYKKLNIRR
ncbi:tyrosine-type recombinase/integrase [Mollicutes bacterium LVI A0039]|nr:tyrosine-type recombinase/integrase [Mollicutes bacterium LVI A0039]